MKLSKYIAFSLIGAGLVFSGCGSSSSDATQPSTLSTTETSGQLVDSYVANVDYECGDGSVGVTDINGSFHCNQLPVRFKLQGLELGKIDKVSTDKQVFPQDLLGVDRNDTNNTAVVAMAQFLQSCDEDNNTRNGIQIKAEVKEAFADVNTTFNPEDVDAYAVDAHITLIPEDEAHTHLESTTQLIEQLHKYTQEEQQRHPQEDTIKQNIVDLILTPANTLNQATKDTLAYMGNEERLAYDVYSELYNYHLENGDGAITTLNNIAQNSEKTHIHTVQLLVQKYISDLSEFSNTDAVTDTTTPFSFVDATKDVTQLPTGVYSITHIQELHDALIAKGEQSTQDALEVGCMVEVTDITDLTEQIAIAQESNASDIVGAFEFLRDASYNHYWAFDKALKNMGVEDGCCTLGDEYCHPEYPQQGNAQSGEATGEQQAHYGQAQGEQNAQAGEATGEQQAHYGQAQGEQNAQAGEATGEQQAHYGQAQGEQNAQTGEATGEQQAHYGQAQGEQNAQTGEATGEQQAHYGQAQGEQNAQAGEATATSTTL